MKARALLKTEHYGTEIMRVNLQGRGVVDCDTKLAMLAAKLNANYWEIQYDREYEDAARLVVHRNQISVRAQA
jgi:hypothetical protein